jgi:hypothetical protein
MENAPEFDSIYGLNIVNGLEDKNGNGVVGGLRNNVIQDSLMYHWRVYRLFNISKLELPSIGENETFASQKAGGTYDETLIYDSYCIYPGTGVYLRKDGTSNTATYATKGETFVTSYPNAVHPSPSDLAFDFKEAGIYKVCLEVEFDYYNYSAMTFGENRSQRGDYKKSCLELPAKPGYFSPPDSKKWPVFNHRKDSRFVVVLARDKFADGKYIKGVSVSTEGGSTSKHIKVDEVKRDPLFETELSKEINKSAGKDPKTIKFDKNLIKIKRGVLLRNKAFIAAIDSERMNSMNIVGDFAIKFVGAVPDRGDTAGSTDKDSAERSSGIGEYDYAPDESTDAGLGFGTGDSKHPSNFANAATGDFVIMGLKSATELSPTNSTSGTTHKVTPDLKSFILRNYGMSGHGTITKALSQAKLDFFRNSSITPVSFRKRIITPPAGIWNAKTPTKYPIRKVDWNNVKYQWYISYKIDGKIYTEEPTEYSGTILEIMEKYESEASAEKGRIFIKELGSSLPDVSGNARSLFDTADGYTLDDSQAPGFHVKFPMLAKLRQ